MALKLKIGQKAPAQPAASATQAKPAVAKQAVKAPVSTGNTAASVLAKMQKDMGETIGSYGGSLEAVERLPTGIFPLDLAIGGGLPRGKASIIWGPESAGKSNLVLKVVANHQKKYPELTCVFFDVEHAFDPIWARAMGVDTDRLIVIPPSYAEQLIDMVEGFLAAEDCGIVVVDSLAALTTMNETQSSAEKANVGGASNPVGKLVRKTTLIMGQAQQAGRHPTLLYVNQVRHKIGVMFGNPETMPGGNAPKFQVAMNIRLYGKNEKDAKVSSAMPVAKHVTFGLQKWKVPILAAAGQYTQIMVPHDGFEVGECDDWNSVSAYLEQLGQLEKLPKGGWQALGQTYPTAKAFRQRLESDKAFGAQVRAGIIQRLLQEGKILQGEAK